MEPVMMVHVSRTERPDSIEIGSPSKGGTLKVYFDAADLDDAEMRVRNGYYIRDIARSLQEAKT